MMNELKKKILNLNATSDQMEANAIEIIKAVGFEGFFAAWERKNDLIDQVEIEPYEKALISSALNIGFTKLFTATIDSTEVE